MDNKKIKELFNEIQIDISDEQIKKFNLFKKNLLEWNDKINLTTITNEDEIWIKHYLDSCTICRYIEQNTTVIDVGTGAGFPGIPLKIINNDIHITLLDSLNKRINFLKDCNEKLKLDNVSIVHGRAEDYAQDKNYREKYDYTTSRAVANLSTLSEYCLPFVKVGGLFISMKAGNVEEEIEEAKKAIQTLGGEIVKVEKFTLPKTDIERTIILIKKIKSTSKEYPRKAGLPSKNPIK